MELDKLLDSYDMECKNPIPNLLYDLSNLKETDKGLEAFKAELLALSFRDYTGEKYWGLYDNSLLDLSQKDKVYEPSTIMLNKEILDYWRKRALKVKSPFLKKLYTGLVWDYSKNICGEEPDFQIIKIGNIDASIDIVKKDLTDSHEAAFAYIEYAIKMLLKFHYQDEKLNSAMKIMINYTHKYEHDNLPGIWGRLFKFLIINLRGLQNFEDEIVEDNINRFERLIESVLNCREFIENDMHSLICETTLLCDYYNKIGNKEKLGEVLLRVFSCIKKISSDNRTSWTQRNIKIMQKIYSKYFDSINEKHFYNIIQKLPEEDAENVIFQANIDNETLNNYFAPMFVGTNDEIIKRFLLKYIPKEEEEKKAFHDLQKEYPLPANLNITISNDWGMPINYIHDESSKLKENIFLRMKIADSFLSMHVDGMKSKGIFTYDKVMAIIEKSPIFDKSQIEIIRQGIKSYFDENYIISCHLLTIQFEAAIRNICLKNNITVLRPNQNSEDGNEFFSLDHLLVESKCKDAQSKELFTYYQMVFTDKVGYNLRNLICHGALPTSSFDGALADRILHAFMSLTLI